MKLKDKTVFITGATRGIGREIALRFARDGANIVVTGKTAEPNPKAAGTIHSTAHVKSKQAGGRALPLQLDIRDENAVASGGKGGGGEIWRHRHPGQQCQRAQHHRHPGNARQAL